MKNDCKDTVFISDSPLGAGGYFNFESDFIEDNVRCIPMIARFKLDACSIKLSLKQWSKMQVEERNFVAEADCSSEPNLALYKSQLINIILNRTGEIAKELTVETEPEWALQTEVPSIVGEQCKALQIEISIKQWQQLYVLQRFALVKLSKSSHENRNLPLALKEFGLIA